MGRCGRFTGTILDTQMPTPRIVILGVYRPEIPKTVYQTQPHLSLCVRRVRALSQICPPLNGPSPRVKLWFIEPHPINRICAERTNFLPCQSVLPRAAKGRYFRRWARNSSSGSLRPEKIWRNDNAGSIRQFCAHRILFDILRQRQIYHPVIVGAW